MTDVTVSVDQASVRLEQIRHAVARGQADISALIEAQGAVDAARLVEAERARIEGIRERLDVLDAIAVEIAWFEGDDLAEAVRRYVRAHRAAVAALAEARVAWSDLAGEWHRHMRRVRLLAESADALPDGVEVSPLMGRDVEVTTVNGAWNSASGLRADHVAAIVECSRDVASGRAPRSGLLGRLGRWYARGTGHELPDGGGSPPAA